MKVEFAAVEAAVARLRERIARAAARAGRNAEEIRLIAVTKTFGADAVRAAHEAGVRHFGENWLQEWDAKRSELGTLEGAVFHMIGHLQRNKARRAAAIFDRVDSVDSVALARKLDHAAGELGRKIPVLVEVRLSEEPAKTGIDPEVMEGLCEELSGLAHLTLEGLMTIPPWSEEAEASRPYFRRLRELRDLAAEHLGKPLPVLSMGMTTDFEIAIEEGATEVRVGTAIFGKRTKPEPKEADQTKEPL